MHLLRYGKLEEARFILEYLAFRWPKDPKVLYNQGMVYSEFNELLQLTPEQVHTIGNILIIELSRGAGATIVISSEAIWLLLFAASALPDPAAVAELNK